MNPGAWEAYSQHYSRLNGGMNAAHTQLGDLSSLTGSLARQDVIGSYVTSTPQGPHPPALLLSHHGLNVGQAGSHVDPSSFVSPSNLLASSYDQMMSASFSSAPSKNHMQHLDHQHPSATIYKGAGKEPELCELRGGFGRRSHLPSSLNGARAMPSSPLENTLVPTSVNIGPANLFNAPSPSPSPGSHSWRHADLLPSPTGPFGVLPHEAFPHTAVLEAPDKTSDNTRKSRMIIDSRTYMDPGFPTHHACAQPTANTNYITSSAHATLTVPPNDSIDNDARHALGSLKTPDYSLYSPAVSRDLNFTHQPHFTNQVLGSEHSNMYGLGNKSCNVSYGGVMGIGNNNPNIVSNPVFGSSQSALMASASTNHLSHTSPHPHSPQPSPRPTHSQQSPGTPVRPLGAPGGTKPPNSSSFPSVYAVAPVPDSYHLQNSVTDLSAQSLISSGSPSLDFQAGAPSPSSNMVLLQDQPQMQQSNSTSKYLPLASPIPAAPYSPMTTLAPATAYTSVITRSTAEDHSLGYDAPMIPMVDKVAKAPPFEATGIPDMTDLVGVSGLQAAVTSDSNEKLLKEELTSQLLGTSDAEMLMPLSESSVRHNPEVAAKSACSRVIHAADASKPLLMDSSYPEQSVMLSDLPDIEHEGDRLGLGSVSVRMDDDLITARGDVMSMNVCDAVNSQQSLHASSLPDAHFTSRVTYDQNLSHLQQAAHGVSNSFKSKKSRSSSSTRKRSKHRKSPIICNDSVRADGNLMTDKGEIVSANVCESVKLQPSCVPEVHFDSHVSYGRSLSELQQTTFGASKSIKSRRGHSSSSAGKKSKRRKLPIDDEVPQLDEIPPSIHETPNTLSFPSNLVYIPSDTVPEASPETLPVLVRASPGSSDMVNNGEENLVNKVQGSCSRETETFGSPPKLEPAEASPLPPDPSVSNPSPSGIKCIAESIKMSIPSIEDELGFLAQLPLEGGSVSRKVRSSPRNRVKGPVVNNYMNSFLKFLKRDLEATSDSPLEIDSPECPQNASWVPLHPDLQSEELPLEDKNYSCGVGQESPDKIEREPQISILHLNSSSKASAADAVEAPAFSDDEDSNHVISSSLQLALKSLAECETTEDVVPGSRLNCKPARSPHPVKCEVLENLTVPKKVKPVSVIVSDATTVVQEKLLPTRNSRKRSMTLVGDRQFPSWMKDSETSSTLPKRELSMRKCKQKTIDKRQEALAKRKRKGNGGLSDDNISSDSEASKTPQVTKAERESKWKTGDKKISPVKNLGSEGDGCQQGLLRHKEHHVSAVENLTKADDSLTSLKENFEVYIQTLVSQVLDADFISEIIKENDEYFLSHLHEIEAFTVKKKSVFARHLKWNQMVKDCVELFPIMNVSNVHGSEEKSACQMCGADSNLHISEFKGEPYDFTTLSRRQNESRHKFLTKKKFVLCTLCIQAIESYAKLHHQKYNFYIKCVSKVNDIKKADPTKESHVILEQCLQDTEWMNKLFIEVQAI